MERVRIIGGGLAGTEAAWQVAHANIPVTLYEMRPLMQTPAHKTGFLAELVCSNSLGSEVVTTGGGLLKMELAALSSHILELARKFKVPAGRALAVDRERFARAVTCTTMENPLIEVCRKEVTDFQADTVTIIATGPLTSPALCTTIKALSGERDLYFFDAAAPLVSTDSIDLKKVFRASRYGEGGDYLNCPMREEEFRLFWQALIDAEVVPLHDFEKERLFEGCLPVEELARRGYKTLLFGPLKPVGLKTPQGERPFAVVQLRQDNQEGTLYNMVGFQTRLRWNEQKRIFRMIPGLEQAEFARLGVMHRNTFLNSPDLLLPTLQSKHNPLILFAGQITGVEGYLESTLIGLWAGRNAVRLIRGEEPLIPPPTIPSGALIKHITTEHPRFQPINMNFGLLPPISGRMKKKDRRLFQVKRVEETLSQLASSG